MLIYDRNDKPYKKYSQIIINVVNSWILQFGVVIFKNMSKNQI